LISFIFGIFTQYSDKQLLNLEKIFFIIVSKWRAERKKIDNPKRLLTVSSVLL
tara:strand:+ start:1934 stop:2092 length:159 start_codon:yes stop_codon:yes gene_type:complete